MTKAHGGPMRSIRRWPHRSCSRPAAVRTAAAEECLAALVDRTLAPLEEPCRAASAPRPPEPRVYRYQAYLVLAWPARLPRSWLPYLPFRPPVFLVRRPWPAPPPSVLRLRAAFSFRLPASPLRRPSIARQPWPARWPWHPRRPVLPAPPRHCGLFRSQRSAPFRP